MIKVQAQDPVSYLLSRINSLRASQGRSPLRLNAQLAAAAQSHSVYLANHPYSDPHIQADGSSPQSRCAAQGYGGRVGENVVGGSTATVEWGFNWWLQSPVHYSNMVSEYWTEIGIGAASGTYGQWFTLDFGDSASPAPASAQGGGGATSANPTAANQVRAQVPTSTPRPRPTRTPTATFTPSLTLTPSLTFTPRFTFTPTATATPAPPTSTPIFLQVSPQAHSATPNATPQGMEITPTGAAVALLTTSEPSATPSDTQEPPTGNSGLRPLIPIAIGFQVVVISGLVVSALLRRQRA